MGFLNVDKDYNVGHSGFVPHAGRDESACVELRRDEAVVDMDSGFRSSGSSYAKAMEDRCSLT